MIHGIKKSTTSIGAQAVSTSSHGEASAQSRSSAPGACRRGHRSPGIHL